MAGGRNDSDRARAAVLDLLARRAPGATVCPSEAARALARAAARDDWRGEMAAVHAAVAALAAEGVVKLTWRGAKRAAGDGPYRIGHPAAVE
ncbi:MAG: DUF3253 domain-containing protein [Cypionkella sp.]